MKERKKAKWLLSDEFVSWLLSLAWETVFRTCAKCREKPGSRSVSSALDVISHCFEILKCLLEKAPFLIFLHGMVMSALLFSLGWGNGFSPTFAFGFTFLSLFPLFLKPHFEGAIPILTYTPNSHTLRWKTCFPCFILVIQVACNCHLDLSSGFPPVPPKLFLQEEQLSIAFLALRREWRWFCSNKLLDSVVHWAITMSLVGFYGGTCVFYTEYRHCWNDSWKTMNCAQRRGTTVKTGKTDNDSRWTSACKPWV